MPQEGPKALGNSFLLPLRVAARHFAITPEDGLARNLLYPPCHQRSDLIGFLTDDRSSDSWFSMSDLVSVQRVHGLTMDRRAQAPIECTGRLGQALVLEVVYENHSRVVSGFYMWCCKSMK